VSSPLKSELPSKKKHSLTFNQVKSDIISSKHFKLPDSDSDSDSGSNSLFTCVSRVPVPK
jgi:hypothetical protein